MFAKAKGGGASKKRKEIKKQAGEGEKILRNRKGSFAE